jgi:hypothetical protein
MKKIGRYNPFGESPKKASLTKFAATMSYSPMDVVAESWYRHSGSIIREALLFLFLTADAFFLVWDEFELRSALAVLITMSIVYVVVWTGYWGRHFWNCWQSPSVWIIHWNLSKSGIKCWSNDISATFPWNSVSAVKPRGRFLEIKGKGRHSYGRMLLRGMPAEFKDNLLNLAQKKINRKRTALR